MLLAAGADVNAAAGEGAASLTLAAAVPGRGAGMIEALVKAGARGWRPDGQGMLAL